MKVETYEQVETTNECETLAQDHESIELIEKLGLKGQKSLLNPETKTRCPYRQMTKDEEFVFKQVCPSRSSTEDFAAGSIPLRILQIIAWAKDQNIFKRLEIWYADSAQLKDPVLVGYVQDPKSSWCDNIFILARWADELLPLQVLLPDAYKKWWDNRNRDLIEQRADTDKKLAEHKSLQGQVHIPKYL